VRSFFPVFLPALMLATLGAGLASAQSIDFTLLASVPGQQPVSFPNDTPINLSATSNSVTITATYVGSSLATIMNPPNTWIVGSVEFTATVPKTETFPMTLGPGNSFSFTITFNAASSAAASALLTIPYTEPAATATGTLSSAIIIPLNGTAPLISLAYALAPNNNLMGIQTGGTIKFPPTQINTPAGATLVVLNTGSGQAEITNITYPGSTSPFQLSDVPLATTTTPYTLGAQMQLNMGITYTPTAVENDTGQVVITFSNGVTDTINLAGSGVTSTFSYSYLSGSSTTPTPLTAGQTITFPPVNYVANATNPVSSPVIVQVKNTGAVTGTITSVSVVGPGFQFVNQATTFPVMLATGNTTSFTISYTPTEVGTQTGTLAIGNAVFTVSGTGLGPQLSFSYSSNGTSISVGAGGAVVFPSIAVTQSETVPFIIANSGTTSATVSLVSTSAPFSVTSVPPTTLAAGKSITVPITFTPTTEGPVQGTLLVNNTSIPLVGAGTTPPALPSYTISGPSGTVAPASQASVSLTLAQPYPVDLTGVLTLTTSGTLGTDPSVEFPNGQRTVDFVIPAGSTSANFAGQGSDILIQTGTVAETVTLAPTFATTAGVNITPTSPPTLQFSIPPAVPVIESIEITNSTGSQTSATFDIVLVGYSTTRDLSTLTVTFTPATGFNLSTSQTSVDLSGVSSVWFQSTASQGFGGLFQVTVPFNLTGSVGTGQNLLEALASVSATISNSVGTSSSAQANVQ
jgi:hypothetical protein